MSKFGFVNDLPSVEEVISQKKISQNIREKIEEENRLEKEKLDNEFVKEYIKIMKNAIEKAIEKLMKSSLETTSSQVIIDFRQKLFVKMNETVHRVYFHEVTDGINLICFDGYTYESVHNPTFAGIFNDLKMAMFERGYYLDLDYVKSEIMTLTMKTETV
jgi:hypothetical protein